MSNPYPAETQQLRRLTPKGVATLQELNDRDEAKMDDLRKVRAELMAEVASVDDVMHDMQATVDQRRAKIRGDVISLLPVGEQVPHPTGPQGDPVVHAALFAASDPDGSCKHCGHPVWRVSTSEASPTGLIHSFGATCYPDSPDTQVAELAES